MIVLLLACAGGGDVDSAPADGTTEGTTPPRGALQLRFPLLEVELFEQTTGVDHDPAVYEEASMYAVICTNYDGRSFPWCYDEHDGSDYLLSGGFDTMDAGSATIVAASPGVVVETEDGNYDRCHATVEGIDCDGHEQRANYVILEHEGGWRTLYWHMMSGSVAVQAGDVVACGDPLGRVGSSGNSSMPHLHFELQSADGVALDPYAGAWSQPETWWVDQGEPEGFPADACAD